MQFSFVVILFLFRAELTAANMRAATGHIIHEKSHLLVRKLTARYKAVTAGR